MRPASSDLGGQQAHGAGLSRYCKLYGAGGLGKAGANLLGMRITGNRTTSGNKKSARLV